MPENHLHRKTSAIPVLPRGRVALFDLQTCFAQAFSEEFRVLGTHRTVHRLVSNYRLFKIWIDSE